MPLHVCVQLLFSFPGFGLNTVTPTGSKQSLAGHTCLTERSVQLLRPGEIRKSCSSKQGESCSTKSGWTWNSFFYTEQALVFLHSSSDTWDFLHYALNFTKNKMRSSMIRPALYSSNRLLQPEHLIPKLSRCIHKTAYQISFKYQLIASLAYFKSLQQS